MHTVALAHEALGLTGNPGAASAAVFTLLGPDPRFQLDGEGVWSMAGPRPGTPLSELHYAVVDVETTGGSYGRGHRLTDIAIYEVRGGVVEDEYRSLVNPGRTIPFPHRSTDRHQQWHGLVRALLRPHRSRCSGATRGPDFCGA